MNNIKLIDGMNASQITSFLKNDIGGGSMGNALKILYEKKNNINIGSSKVINFLLGAVIGGFTMYFGHKYLHSDKEVIEYIDTIDLKNKIDNMSEEEIENMVENKIREKELSLDYFEIFKLNNIEYLADCFIKEYTPSNNLYETKLMQQGLDWVINIVRNSKYNDSSIPSKTYFNERLDKCIDMLEKHKKVISGIEIDGD